jgi:hypothetical protein
MAFSIYRFAWSIFAAWLVLKLYNVIYNLLLHPLAKYPGPLPARVTDWWKTYIEVVKKESFVHLVIKLHEEYGMFDPVGFLIKTRAEKDTGDVVRVSPNEVVCLA